jgi:hypothetical protein
MRHFSFKTLLLALTGAAALAACNEDNTTEPLTEVEAVIVADQAMSDADQDVGHARAPGIPGLRFPRRIFQIGTGDTPDCPQDETGAYVCTHEGFGGLEGTTRITFFDEAGGVQSAYDEELTASVHIESEMEGTFDRGRFTGSMSRSRDLTVSGLLGDETTRVWNGTTQGSSTRTHTSGELAGEEISTTSSSTIEDLTLPLPENETGPWPLSGAITTEMSASGGPHEGDHTIVITFDGTQFATIMVDGEEMTVDLLARRGGHHGMGPRHHGGGN